MRHPKEIAQELKALHDDAKRAFAPPNVGRAIELLVEFTSSVAESIAAMQQAPGQPAAAAPKKRRS